MHDKPINDELPVVFKHIEVRPDGSQDPYIGSSEHDPHVVDEEEVATELHKHVVPPQRKDVTAISSYEAAELLIVDLPPTQNKQVTVAF